MRKYLMVVVAAIVSALALPSIAQADDIQSITAKLTPEKRSKKKFKPAQIYVEILTPEQRAIRPTRSSRRAPPTRRSTSRRTRSSTRRRVPRCKGTEASSRTRRPSRRRHLRQQVDRQQGQQAPTGPGPPRARRPGSRSICPAR